MRFPCPSSFATALFLSAIVARAEVVESDVVIFGGTSGGVAAAVQAHRMGKTAVIAEWTPHLGGLTTGGLGATDIGNKGAIGGIAREFYEQIAEHYTKPEAWTWQKPQAQDVKHEKSKDPLEEKTGRLTKWTFEPHVAMDIYKKWLADAGVKVYLGEKLKSVKMDGQHIVEFTTESGDTFRGKMFIDASYEGDLMARAGVSYHVGREANTEFNETLNGFREKTPQHQFTVDVDPYLTPGDPKSGLLPFIQENANEKPGAGDKRVQAYNFRLCMTRTKENLVPWSELKPANYDEKNYELLGRFIDALEKSGKPPTGLFMGPTPMPNDKTDTNNAGAFSTDFIGENYAYPNADYPERERITQAHADYIKGMLYFLSSSQRVPQHVRDTVNHWGLAKDEFTENGHFPTALYVREGRRMMSDYVMTEANCRWQKKAEDPVALGAYNMDSHNCQRIVQNGFVRNEGDVEVGVAGPYPVSYRSIVPKAGQAENLLVPVCLSATHIAYGSIRMEPVFMILGQSAATAACLAIDAKVTVQKLDYAPLRTQLDKDHQILEWTGPAHHMIPPPPKLDGIVLDDTDGQRGGEWTQGSINGSQRVGDGYIHDQNQNKGALSVHWTPDIPIAGNYEIIFHFPPNGNRAKNVPVTISIKGGESKTIKVNEQDQSGQQSLGVFALPIGHNTTISVSNAETDGFVVVDGVQLLRVRQ
ncbi:putative xanthan lyase [Chthoniobacter flavus Ellin428]|uniref:Putative xanthan lyase n=1 Tax=Chthoniobacter flavus Ellin428 TaxID=497964 RepID=B4CWQ7_9BACT|nr:FAD-dependent oxidoreductase [Chthoniobacter flavus]EDY21849.1 putative xanthan lyase [Chthoniobacter flavus Ellin428]TCO95775.1 FAD dependent oxidoreductase [Chthoniobacter flavus]